jgi:hypothetical protein
MYRVLDFGGAHRRRWRVGVDNVSGESGDRMRAGGGTARENPTQRGGFEYVAFVVQASVGGQRSHAGIWNPADSGRVLRVEELDCLTTTGTSNTVAGFYTVANVAPFVQSATPVRSVDTRTGVPASLVVAITVANAALQSDGGAAVRRAFLGTNQPREFQHIILLRPGVGLVCVPDANATEIRAGYHWREYANH